MSSVKNNETGSTAIGRVKVNSSDLLGYLADKLEGDTTIDITPMTNADGSYYLELSVNSSVVGVDNFTVKLNAGDASPDYLIAKLDEVFAASLVLQDYLTNGTGLSFAIGGGGVITFALDADVADLNNADESARDQGALLNYDLVSAKWECNYFVRENGFVSWATDQIIPSALAIDKHITDDNNTTTGNWSFSGTTTIDDLITEKITRGTTTVTSTPYTVLDSDHILLLDVGGGNPTINLPAAASNSGRVLKIQKYDGDGVSYATLDPNGTEQINDTALFILNKRRHSVEIVCDGTEWHIIGETHQHRQEDISAAAGDATMGHGADLVAFTASSGGANNELMLPDPTKLNGGEKFTIWKVAGSDNIILNDYTTATDTINNASPTYSTAATSLIVQYDKTNANWVVIEQ
jgi:hypothetical protein